MDKKQIKKVMAIVRPAVVALYGRQSLDLTAYSQMGESCLWVEVQGWSHAESDFVYYKARIEEGKVTYLNKGELKA